MNKVEILISDLEDIKEILDNNGYAMWGERLLGAVELLKRYIPMPMREIDDDDDIYA